MSLDPQKIADNVVVAFIGLIFSFIGGWVVWVTSGLLKAKRDLDFAHRHLRRLDNVANDRATSVEENHNASSSFTNYP